MSILALEENKEKKKTKFPIKDQKKTKEKEVPDQRLEESKKRKFPNKDWKKAKKKGKFPIKDRKKAKEKYRKVFGPDNI